MIDTPGSLIAVPEGYATWQLELKTRIHSAQQRATLALNRDGLCTSTGPGQEGLAPIPTFPQRGKECGTHWKSSEIGL